MKTIDLTPTLTPPGRATWLAIGELGRLIGNEQWAIVGGQMVALHARRFGLTPARPTTDGDLLVDVQTHGRSAMRQVADALVALGFVIDISPEGVTRFTREAAKVDLLAPDGVGADVVTFPPGHAVQAPGATQALERAETVLVIIGDEEMQIRTPTLVGAIVAKAAATSIPGTRDERLRHQQDLAVLLSLAARLPIRPLVDELTKKDRTSLRSASAPWIDDDLHEAWFAVENQVDVRRLIAIILTPP
jgi:hypothetical protein